MYNFTRENVDVETIRKRFAAMDDATLERYGRAVAALAWSSKRAVWRVQLEAARDEWRRRRTGEVPKRVNGPSQRFAQRPVAASRTGATQTK